MTFWKRLLFTRRNRNAMKLAATCLKCARCKVEKGRVTCEHEGAVYIIPDCGVKGCPRFLRKER